MDSVDKMIGTFISFGIIICILKIQNGEKATDFKLQSI